MPDTNSCLAQALSAWAEVVGPDNVLSDPPTLRSVGTTTFVTGQRVHAVVRPADRSQVQACVRIANRYRVPIYVISTGKNWGYGSKVPVRDGSVLVDLGRLDHIVDYNEKLAHITVEPGVTFKQVFAFLDRVGSRLRVNATGSTANSSLIGNALERGLGSGEYADRFAHTCNMEVVLPTGESIRTGFGRFPGARAAEVGRWGVGPYVDGIFTQSNLGIITKMTFWLMPPAEFSRTCLFSLDHSRGLPALIDALQELKFKGICRDAVRMYNDYKRLSGVIQFPFGAAGEDGYLSRALMESIREALGLGAWFGELHISSANRRQGLLECELISEALQGKVDALDFTGDEVTGASHVSAIHGNSRTSPDRLADIQTVANMSGLRSIYWRKRTPPDEIDPDRDGCGVLWCAPLVPFDGEQVQDVVQCVEQVMLAHRYEPAITLAGITERSMVVNAVLVYDRDVPGQDELAMACYMDLQDRLVGDGSVPYRFGIQSMRVAAGSDEEYTSFLSRLKEALDPNGILSPGRYLPV